MNRFLFAAAALVGALAILWVGEGFVRSGNILALSITLLIGLVYAIGVVELFLFRRQTTSLEQALAAVPAELASLESWLAKVPSSLQNSVRLRIEGERMGLPGPALTPYLVGLLVMLGMLGTFLGMVVSLQGAVSALEGTTELEAIRSGLAAPIKGLGLAFGTSVAGVAASALLGLLSTLSRRDRLQAAQLLDRQVATNLRGYSLTHNRQETYRALQLQAQALPNLVEKLEAMASNIERMGNHLNERLLGNQDQFHRSAQSLYQELARSVDQSLKESLAESGRLTGDSIRPIIAEAMTGIAQEAQNTHRQLLKTAEHQLEGWANRLDQAAITVTAQWQQAAANHEQVNERIADQLSQSLAAWTARTQNTHAQLIQTAQAQLAELSQRFARSTAEVDAHWQAGLSQQQATQQRLLDGLSQSLGDFNQGFQQNADLMLASIQKAFAGLQTSQADQERQRLEQWTSTLASMAAQLGQEWQKAGAQAAEQHQAFQAALDTTSRTLTNRFQANSSSLLQEVTKLLGSSQELVKTRMDVEEAWLKQHGERMDQLATSLRTELSALTDAEAARGQAAVDQLASLQSALVSHLAALGTALEAPMARLIETASEAPRAAADVIGQLRQEISNNMVRDNQLLEERTRIMQGLDLLLNSLNRATSDQSAAIETLVQVSAGMLQEVSGQFSAQVSAEAAKLSGIAAQVTGSALEVSSLGETFGFAVQRFAETNEKLMDKLSLIEAALETSSTRSNEQLAYYVAQAREIIDLSMLSQKEIFEELRQLKAAPQVLRTGAA